MNETSQAPTCSRCGAPLSSDALKGLCPRCLMELNLSAPTEIPGEVGPHGTKITKPLPTLEEIAKHFPQFEILECLGRGGMGVVYKARQPKLNRVVALKILAPERVAEPKFAERFQREAQALARLNHPNIVTVYDFGEMDGLYYLTMEFVDGVGLRQLLQTRKIEPEEALVIVPKICEALQYAHDEGVVHRDIKPENILLDKKGRVKIADFGIAKIMAEDPLTPSLSPSYGARVPARADEGKLTQDQILGTPNYMAPEQKEQPQKVDHRADIYSLGVVFYEMLTGELPIGKFQPPSKRVQVDVRLDEVVLHTLEKEPERRYQQASQVKTAVETIASTPHTPSAAAAEPSLTAVQNRLSAPAIGLMVVGSLNLLLFLMGCFGALVALTRRDEVPAGVGLALCLPFLIVSAVVIFGAAQMHRLRSYGLAIAAAIIALVTPSPALPLGFCFGVLALVRLTRPGVREAFQRARLSPEVPSSTSGKDRRALPWVVGAGATGLLLGLGLLLLAVGWLGRKGSLPPRGLVAWWPLEGHATDIVGGANGSLTGSFLFVPAEVGRGIQLEGPRSGISVPDSPELNFGPDQDFSIEAWVKPLPWQSEFGVMDIVDKREAPNLTQSHGYAMALRNGKLCFVMADSLKGNHLNWEQYGPDLRDGLWHHVAVTVDRTSTTGVNLYVDGRAVATFDPTPARGDLGTQQPLLIGMHQSYPWFQGNYRGGLDEVSLYRRALSPTEIQAIFDAGKKGKPKPRHGSSHVPQPRDEVAAVGMRAAEEAAHFATRQHQDRLQEKAAPAEEAIDLGGGVKMEFVLIPAGSFVMGCATGTGTNYAAEKPAHEVTITKPFYLGRFEVTQEQWESVTGKNPSRFKGPTLPVDNVGWDECQDFLFELQKKTRRRIVLPTEAQWEYACRAGTQTDYSFGDSKTDLADYGWFSPNSGGRTHTVGQKWPNPWGLYDMHGNVAEWCADWLDDYAAGPAIDPRGPVASLYHVVRGGCWENQAKGLRSSSRASDCQGHRRMGVRCAMLVEEVDSKSNACPGFDASARIPGFAMTCQECHVPRVGMPTPEMKQQQDAQVCTNFMKFVVLAARSWAANHDGVMPPTLSTMFITLKSPSILVCPQVLFSPDYTNRPSWGHFNRQDITYETVSSGLRSDDLTAAYLRCPIHNKVARVDGSIVNSSPSQFTPSPPADDTEMRADIEKDITPGATSKPAFGPVIERVLYCVAPQRPIKAEDLDGGRELEVPAELAKGREEQVFQWLAAQGADLLAFERGRSLALATSPTLASVSPATWDRPAAADLRAALKSIPVSLERIESDAKEGFIAYRLEASAVFPLTFAFETKAGGIGVLQITGISDSPRGVKIRYRLVH